MKPFSEIGEDKYDDDPWVRQQLADREELREAVSEEVFEQIMSAPLDVREPMMDSILKQFRGMKAQIKKTKAQTKSSASKRQALAKVRNDRKAKHKRASKSKRGNR